jgi:hypothetical protein
VVRTIARTVGGYEIVRVIGRGGMATVYLARQTELQREVALKELTLFDGADPEQARRFLREARLAGSFSHPNIVTVHDYLEEDGRPYIAMEYLERGSLRPYVGRMSLAQVGGVLQGVLSALMHAEERGVVHRDLKPENLMVTTQGSVKVADFGIAKATSATQTGDLTTTGTTLGTPHYMAPERAMGQEIGPWSDLYSVGVIVFELLVGRRPFDGTDTPMAILMRQINEPIPPVSSLVPDVDLAISDWIERLLVKDPERRTRSAAVAWDQLDDILGGMLGARWQRHAALPERPGSAAAERTTAPAAAAAEPAGVAVPEAAAAAQKPTGATRRLPMTEPDMTEAPFTVALAPDEPAKRRGLPQAARLALVAGALVAGIAGAAAVRGGGSEAPRPRATPTVAPVASASAAATPTAAAEYATALSAAIGDLAGLTRGHRADLGAATTAATRSAASSALAADYRAAVKALAGLDPGSQDRAAHGRLVTALGDTAAAYDEAAAAAKRGDGSGYTAAQADADRSRTAVDAAIAALPSADSEPGPAAGATPTPTDGGSAGSGSGSGTNSGSAGSGVGDSKSDDPSDDAPDDNGD